MKLQLCAAVLIFCAGGIAGAAEQVERSEVLTMGNQAGFQEARYADDGSLRVHFEFNDRGRGPRLDSEYRIAADQVEPFLALMLQRRRAQGRNGARRWILTRNLHNVSVWTETFRTPTWNDYLRFNYRQTAADRALNTSLLDLHMGPDAPEVILSIERPTAAPRKADIFRPDTPHS